MVDSQRLLVGLGETNPLVTPRGNTVVVDTDCDNLVTWSLDKHFVRPGDVLYSSVGIWEGYRQSASSGTLDLRGGDANCEEGFNQGNSLKVARKLMHGLREVQLPVVERRR